MTSETCPHCLLTFTHAEKHVELCKVNQPYVQINKTQCVLCMKTFKNEEILYAHFRIKHPFVGKNAGQRRCSLCLNYVSALPEHLKLCQRVFEFSNLQELACQICQKKFRDQRNLYYHIDKHLQANEGPKRTITGMKIALRSKGKSNGKYFICPHCSKPKQTANFERHEELCKLLLPYIIKQKQCGICLKKTKNRTFLFRHFQSSHPELTKNAGHQCPLCMNHYSNDEHLKLCKKLIHFANIKDFSCKVCQRKCLNRGQLYTHIKHYHMKDVENHVLSLIQNKLSKERKLYSKISDYYQCLMCNYSFTSKYALIEHIISLHDKVLNDDIEQGNIRPRDESIVEYNNAKSGELPMENVSMISPEVKKEIIEEIIEESKVESQMEIFESQMEVKEEIKQEYEAENQIDIIHKTETKSMETGFFKCQICPKAFSSEQLVKMHVQIFHKISITN